MLEVIAPSQRESLFLGRAKEWGVSLTPEQYVERNRRLYAHPFGNSSITTYGWKINGDWASSFDLLQVSIGGKKGYLIASVLTHPEYRKKGYATQLLDKVLPDIKDPIVLYSDIDPKFYERWGFIKNPRVEVAFEALETGEGIIPIEWEVGLEKLKVAREGKFALDPKPEWLDWQIDRFRLFAKWADHEFPQHVFYQSQKCGHLFLAAPDFIDKELWVCWGKEHCHGCDASFQMLAHLLTLKKATHWRRSGEGKIKYPMYRQNMFTDTSTEWQEGWDDCQLIDWW